MNVNQRQARIRAGQHPDPTSAERAARRGASVAAPAAKAAKVAKPRKRAA